MRLVRMGQAARLLAVGVAWAVLSGVGTAACSRGGRWRRMCPWMRGYMHLNVAALRGTELFKAYREGVPGAGMAQAGLGRFAEITGFHPLRDLDGITLYTTTLGEREGVMLMYGKINREQVEKHVRLFGKHAEEAYGGHTIHTWWDAKNDRTVAGTVYSDELMVSADSVERLKAALDVLDGKKGASAGGSEMVKRYPKGALFHGEAEDLGTLAARSESQVLRNAKSVQMTVGEMAGTLTATLTLELKEDRQALQVKRFVDGIRAAAALNDEKAPAAAKLMDAVSVQSNGPTVTVTLNYASKDLLPELKALREERLARLRAAEAGAGAATKPAGGTN